MDYELLLRSYKICPSHQAYSIVISNWVEGGIGTGQTLKVLSEYCQNRISSGAFNPLTSRITYLLSLIAYFLKSIVRFSLNSFSFLYPH